VADARKPRVLLADDERAITDELVPLLERSGFQVAVAHDGRQALELLASYRPDLVVLDVVMPAMDGREVCRQLRAGGNWTPIIMLTRVGSPGERAMSLNEGADDYLNKPFDPFELVARIRAVLRRGRAGGQSLAGAARLVCGPLTVDRPSRRALLEGRDSGVLACRDRARATARHPHGNCYQEHHDRTRGDVGAPSYPQGGAGHDVQEEQALQGDHPIEPRGLRGQALEDGR